MNTKEFAKLCHVEKRTLFYYDEIGLLKPASRDEKGYREYEPSQAQIMDSIKLLQTASFSLDEIKEILNGSEQDRLNKLTKGVERTNKKIKELITISNFFEGKISLFNEFKEENTIIIKEENFKIKIISEVKKVAGQKFNFTNFNFFTGFYWNRQSLYLYSFDNDEGDIHFENVKSYSFFAKIPPKAFRLVLFIEQKREEFNIPDDYIVLVQQVPHLIFFEDEKVLIKVTYLPQKNITKKE